MPSLRPRDPQSDRGILSHPATDAEIEDLARRML